MKKVLGLFLALLAIGLVGGLYFASDNAIPAPETGIAAAEPAVIETESPSCLSEEEIAATEELSPEELEQWAVDKGILNADQVGGGGTGCPSTELCSDGENCEVVKSCIGPFDTGEFVCPQKVCLAPYTVHYSPCFCTGDTCPITQAEYFHCA